MKKQLFYIILYFILFASCTKNSCYCNKELGFNQVNVIWKSNDSLVVLKRFYYQKTPIFKMESIQDSASNFIGENNSDSVIFKQFDSIYFAERIDNLKGDDVKQYSDKGYFCICND